MLTDRSVRIRIGGVPNESGRFELEKDLVGGPPHERRARTAAIPTMV
jgi:hypothetical protein